MKQNKYISTARPGGRRGGGVAIAYSEERYQVSKLNIEVKKPLECLFALVKAKDTTIHNKNTQLCVSTAHPTQGPEQSS